MSIDYFIYGCALAALLPWGLPRIFGGEPADKDTEARAFAAALQRIEEDCAA